MQIYSTKIYLIPVIKADGRSGVLANATSICGVRFGDARPYNRKFAEQQLYKTIAFLDLGVPEKPQVSWGDFCAE